MRTPFIEMHGTVVYLPSAQGGIYAVFALPLSRDRHALTKQQSFRYFVYLLGFGIVMRAMLRGPRSTLEPVMSAASIPSLQGQRDRSRRIEIIHKTAGHDPDPALLMKTAEGRLERLTAFDSPFLV